MRYDKGNNIIQYKVGDRVRIISKPHRPFSYHQTGVDEQGVYWLPFQKEFCGKYVTISKVLGHGKYRIREDGGTWAWCNAFFKQVNTFDICDDDEDIGAGVFTEYFKKFKVM